MMTLSPDQQNQRKGLHQKLYSFGIIYYTFYQIPRNYNKAQNQAHKHENNSNPQTSEPTPEGNNPLYFLHQSYTHKRYTRINPYLQYA